MRGLSPLPQTRRRRECRFYRPLLELLEDRVTPAIHTWIGLAGGHWSNAANWTGGVPMTGETGGTIIEFGSNSTSVDDIAGLVIDQLHFTGGNNLVQGASGIVLTIAGSSGPDNLINDTGSNTIDSSLSLNLTGQTCTMLVQAGELIVGSAIQGSQGLDLVAGSAAGTLEFAGTAANTYGGDTTVEEGTLLLDSTAVNAAIPSGNLQIGALAAAPGTATVRLARSNQIDTSDFVIILNAGVLDLNGQTQAIGTLVLEGQIFSFTQATTAIPGGLETAFNFTMDGALTVINASSSVGAVEVDGIAGYNTATVITNDTYIGSDGVTHETAEAVTIGSGAAVQKLDSQGDPTDFMTLVGFNTIFAVAGTADEGFINATPGVKNVFVGAGGYAYMNTGNSAEDFYYLMGAKYVYGYTQSASDYAYEYDGSGPSTYVVSGVAYSLEVGSDQGRSFFNEAVGYTFNEGIAQHASQDVAYFYDSPGSDTFVGYSQYSSMTATNGSFAENDIAAYFAQIYAYSFVGGTDYAYLYDAGVNHASGFARIV